jgi:hypothetical protein
MFFLEAKIIIACHFLIVVAQEALTLASNVASRLTLKRGVLNTLWISFPLCLSKAKLFISLGSLAEAEKEAAMAASLAKDHAMGDRAISDALDCLGT